MLQYEFVHIIAIVKHGSIVQESVHIIGKQRVNHVSCIR